MKKQIVKHTAAILLALVLVVSVALPITSRAYEWWRMEAVYTVTGRMPEEIMGPKSRVFFPNVSVLTIDGIDMESSYTVTKDGEEFASGDYTEGMYIDLDGAGEYLFSIRGNEAKNDYSFTVTADEALPSLIADGAVPLYINASEPLKLPAAEIAYGKGRMEAEISLKMANGAVYEYDGNTIPETGLLTATYSADFNGTPAQLSYEITVNNDLLGFYDETGAFYPAGQTPREGLDIHGAVLNGTTGKTYTFSQVLDLSHATKNDPLIVLSNGSETCPNILPKVKIVDANNAQNYIEINTRINVDSRSAIYSVAGAPGQAKIGHLGGVGYYNQTVFGTETTFPSCPEVGATPPATYYYDAAEKAVYANWFGSINLIADFDADYQLKKWDGFSTGEVKIVVERVKDDDFFCVEAVGGQSLAEGAGNDSAPNLAIESDIYESVPYGIVGTAYPVFSVTAVDPLESSLPVDIHVYRGYDMISGVELNVENNAFIPQDAGYYTIVYSSSDSYGNRSERRVNVPVYAKEAAPELTADLPAFPEKALVGEKIMLPEPKNVLGGSGNLTYAVNLITPDGASAPVEGDYVILPEAGKNTIQYAFTDYIGMVHTLDYPITCTKTDAPILYTLSMPDVWPNGKTFTLPEAEYAEDDTVSVEITAKVDGKKIDVTDNAITPTTEKEQAELVITYTAKNGAGKTTAKEYPVTLLGSDLSDRTTFFLPVSGTVEKEQRENSVHFTTMDSDASVRFTSSVLADKLSMLLSVDGEQNDSDRLSVRVVDSLNSDISVRFDIVKIPGADDTSKSQFYINGEQANDMLGNFYGGVENLGITYKKSSMSVADSAGNSLGSVKTLENGKPFEGFPSGEVNLIFSAGTVGEAGFGFDVVQLNNQTFSDAAMFFDNYPEIMVNGDLQLQAELGDTITVPPAVGGDVLSPNTTLWVSVRRGTEIILDNQSASEPFDVTLDQYGTYYIVYNYSDGSVERSVTYPVQIIEHNAPTVDAPKLSKSAKLGEKVKIPAITASDDYSANVTVSVIVQDPNGCMKNVNPDDMSFVAEKTGTYTVFYYIYDECWNYQMLSYPITVK